MKQEEFNASIERSIKLCREVLVKKAPEYSRRTNVMHNKDVCADIMGVSTAFAIFALMTKNFACVRDIAIDGIDFDQAMLDEKIGDSINYLLILKAELEDRLRLNKTYEEATHE